MQSRRIAFLFVGIVICLAAVLSAQKKPVLALSAVRIPEKGHVLVHGSGFTPKHNVSSHLRKPDGTEYPVLPILTDDRGQFTHDIDTLLLPVGTMELWVVDDASNMASDTVKFEVTTEKAKP